ncbi:FAD-dependent monooxygenase [Segnochrobactrum spirostomi]|uniref:NAD(P)-binding protein n=1 Tax=Segnochrobactrum spirostomi TaxID=2608987 RepID=A0A6A7Y414_9HYPH|nr:FAD-dependent monooxygenase [Segnochrobactrum spirostomi]MQT13870.1 NAD(P)-binding protein [Segnochrobactrum spirostomi]
MSVAEHAAAPGHPDVLVVGAGPTGLSLAITLRLHGASVRIIDRAAHPAPVSKALALWSASLEALRGMGVVDTFLEAGARLNALVIGDGDRELARLAVGDGIDSPFPFPLLLAQSRTEEILTARLAALGTTIEREVEFATLAQDATGVTATVKRPDGSEEIVRSAYLVGCDGARSAVRHALAIPFEGFTEPATYLLGDVRFSDPPLDHRSIYLWWHQGSTIALFPFGDDLWRIFAVRAEGAGDAPPDIAELQRHLDRHGPRGLHITEATWLSAFRINARLAQNYREGRVFLAGDAAHIHSPAGGQGMNTGIQDAVNLGWKLAAVLKGTGDAEMLLASYGAERRPVARDVVDGASQKLHLAFSGGGLTRVAKDIAVSIFGNLPVVQRKLQVELSETEVVYRDGPLVALGGGAPRRAGRGDVGGRALDAPLLDDQGGAGSLWPLLCVPRHTLLVFGEAPLPAALAAREGADLRILRLDAARDPAGTVARRYEMARGGWVLVRPDQVVAARGASLDAPDLARYLGRVVSPAAVA